MLEEILLQIVPPIAAGLELIAVIITVVGAVKGLFQFIQGGLKFDNKEARLTLANCLALSLQFMLIAEILKTIIVQNLKSFILLAVVAALRIIVTFVVHWEASGLVETSQRDKSKKDQNT
ncbi:MAG TPA: DUF1622 domain-containing protein [Clostridiaceae bacterium]|nr:DUF1622 domain-containing protein [Clostridiaceae bacterium]